MRCSKEIKLHGSRDGKSRSGLERGAGEKKGLVRWRELLRGRSGGRGRHGAILGAKIGDELRNLLVGQGVAEGRHLLPAVQDLSGDFCGGPRFVRTDAGERGGFFAANAVGAVAVGAALVAEQNSAGFLAGLVFVTEGVSGEETERKRAAIRAAKKSFMDWITKYIFSWEGEGTGRSDGVGRGGTAMRHFIGAGKG